MKVNNRVFFLFGLFLISCGCWGQKFELTSNGIYSAADHAANYIEYKSLNKSSEDLYAYCDHKLGYEVDFFTYTVNAVPQTRTISVEGTMNGSSLLVFGKTEISFRLTFEFKNSTVKVTPELMKTNGKPLNYNILFNKKGNPRLSAPKNKIENEINTLVYKILGEVVEIN